MLGRRQSLLLGISVIAVSIVGGWIWSSIGDKSEETAPALTLTTMPEVQTIPTNAANEGQLLPAVSLTDTDGNEVSTADLQGKPAIINFWFSTCEPCRREMPELQAAFEKYGNEIQFVGVNPQDSGSNAQKFAEKYGVNYQLWTDANGALVGEVGVSTFPTTLFINANGEITLQYAGELTANELTKSIQEALGF